MSTERDVNRIVRSWMEEGVTALPDHILDAVLDQLPATPQRRATWWRVQRYIEMNKPLAIGLVTAAAILVVALIGLNLGPGSGPPPGGEPSTTPAPSSTPAPTPAAMVQGPMDPGTYVSPASVGGAAFDFTVPAGWTTDSDLFVQKNTDADQLVEITTGVMFSAWQVDHVFADACEGDGTEEPIDDAVASLATALANQAGRESSAPAEIEVDGYTGQLVELTAPADLTSCGGRLRTWPALNGDLNSGWPAGPGQIDDVYIVDADGTRLVVVATHWAGTSAADLAELEEIVVSIQIR